MFAKDSLYLHCATLSSINLSASVYYKQARMIQTKTIASQRRHIHLGIAAAAILPAIRLKDVHMLVPSIINIKLVNEHQKSMNRDRLERGFL
jgi:hypothetical protein